MRLTMLANIVFTCALTTLASSCAANNEEKPMAEQQYRQMGWQLGTVTHQRIEGGFYGIITDSGEKLLTLNLPIEMKVANSRVAFKGTLNKDMMTIQQWGTPFHIKEIKLLKKGMPADAY